MVLGCLCLWAFHVLRVYGCCGRIDCLDTLDRNRVVIKIFSVALFMNIRHYYYTLDVKDCDATSIAVSVIIDLSDTNAVEYTNVPCKIDLHVVQSLRHFCAPWLLQFRRFVYSNAALRQTASYLSSKTWCEAAGFGWRGKWRPGNLL